MMPKVDGWEILQSLRLNEKTKHIPIIVCSAWGEPELAKSLGASHFLRKPIVQRELLDVLEALVDA
jgi:CheY-like chemotaxis protein